MPTEQTIDEMLTAYAVELEARATRVTKCVTYARIALARLTGECGLPTPTYHESRGRSDEVLLLRWEAETKKNNMTYHLRIELAVRPRGFLQLVVRDPRPDGVVFEMRVTPDTGSPEHFFKSAKELGDEAKLKGTWIATVTTY